MNVITIVDLDGIPEGSVLQNARVVIDDGEKYWRGLWCSMYGSYMMDVPYSAAKEHIEKKFEITDAFLASPAYQKLLELWKKQKR